MTTKTKKTDSKTTTQTYKPTTNYVTISTDWLAHIKSENRDYTRCGRTIKNSGSAAVSLCQNCLLIDMRLAVERGGTNEVENAWHRYGEMMLTELGLGDKATVGVGGGRLPYGAVYPLREQSKEVQTIWRKAWLTRQKEIIVADLVRLTPANAMIAIEALDEHLGDAIKDENEEAIRAFTIALKALRQVAR